LLAVKHLYKQGLIGEDLYPNIGSILLQKVGGLRDVSQPAKQSHDTGKNPKPSRKVEM
jgi:hypothetical protein